MWPCAPSTRRICAGRWVSGRSRPWSAAWADTTAAMGFAHIEEAPRHAVDTPGVECTWTNLGAAAETASASACAGSRSRPASGRRPPHNHAAEEEIFYVLGGDGLSWLDGDTHEVATGDCIVHLPGAHAHTLRAGPSGPRRAGARRAPPGRAVRAAAHRLRLAGRLVGAGRRPATRPWDRDAAARRARLPAAVGAARRTSSTSTTSRRSSGAAGSVLVASAATSAVAAGSARSA